MSLFMLDVKVRWMIRRDMPEVLEIENHTFISSWTEEDFIKCLRQRNCIGKIAEFEDRVIGYMIYELHKTRLHIINMAVHEDFRRQGVGTQILETMRHLMGRSRRKSITAEVRECNVAAQMFFRAQSFRCISILRNLYEDTPEDAYLFQYLVGTQEVIQTQRKGC